MVRYAAVAGLQNLSQALKVTQPDQIFSLLDQLQALVQSEETPAVRARILFAIESM